MAGVTAATAAATDEELKAALSSLTPEAKAKLKLAIEGSEAATKFGFTSGLPDCCTTNPGNYKVMAEIPNGRIVEMTMKPGEEDTPHDHPVHSMYVVKGGKLSITNFNEGKPQEPHVVELPSGAPPVMPAGVHQVKNVGETDVKIIFVEAYAACTPCGEIKDYISPFTVSPECYTSLAESVRTHAIRTGAR